VVKGEDFVNPLLVSPGGPIDPMAMASSLEHSMTARTSRTSGGRWFKKLRSKEAGPKEVQQPADGYADPTMEPNDLRTLLNDLRSRLDDARRFL
jgi:hypothetical protein